METGSSQESYESAEKSAPTELKVRRPITVTLGLSLFLGVLVPVGVIVGVMYHTTAGGVDDIARFTKEELKVRAFDQLVTVRESTKRQIATLFSEVARDVEAMSKNPYIRDAFTDLKSAAKTARSNNLKEHELMKDAQYQALYEKHAKEMGEYADTFDFDDLFFVCADKGHVYFSLSRGDDFGKSLPSAYPGSVLEKNWRNAIESGMTTISDMEKYAPADNRPMVFVSTPFKIDGGIAGVLGVSVSLSTINEITMQRGGMGETGEVYMVGKDRLMRSDSILDPAHRSVYASFANPETGRVDTSPVQRALAGETGVELSADYRNSTVLAAYCPMDIKGIRWALIAEMDEAEAFSCIEDVERIENMTMLAVMRYAVGLSALLLVILAGVGLGVHYWIAQPIKNMAQAAIAVAQGDLGVTVPAKGASETGILARAMNQMTANLSNVVEQIDIAAAKMEAASKEQAVGATNQSTATSQMSSTTSELLASARQMSENGAVVSELAEGAAKECASGARQVQDAVLGINGVRDRVEHVAQHMVDLGAKSQQISGVLDIINELSEQTNLLSLNASIEAAGAGESGKRFAVVASEIRKLAERAAESTTEIRGLVDNIQEMVNTTIMATEEGTKAVEEGVRLTTQVEGSLESIARQVASTTESVKAIGFASRQQTTAIEEIDGAVRDIDTTAQQAEASARQIQKEAAMLAQASGRFKNVKHIANDG